MKKSRGFAQNYFRCTGAFVLMVLLTLAAFMACLPQEATAAWAKKVIDGGLVDDTSIRVDSKGYVHMSFVKGGSLSYMNNKTGKWVKTMLDSSGQVGNYTSIAIDSNGKVHISYYDKISTTLRYTTNASGAWVKTMVDNSADVGMFTSIAVGSGGKVHISYFDDTNSALKYATGP